MRFGSRLVVRVSLSLKLGFPAVSCTAIDWVMGVFGWRHIGVAVAMSRGRRACVRVNERH